MDKDKLIRLGPRKPDPEKGSPDQDHKPSRGNPEDKPDQAGDQGPKGETSQAKLHDQAKNQDQERIITKIQPQKKKGRYNIYLDGDYAFPISEGSLVKHFLRKGMVVSQSLQKDLEKEDQFSKAYSRALNYLSYALRTEKQVQDDLEDKGFSQDSQAVIAKLKDQALINDLEYAKSYIRTAAKINRKGPRLIQNELVQKGVGDQDIETAMVEYPYQDQVDNASQLVEKQFNKSRNKSQRQRLAKVKSYLFNKGYLSQVIDQALAEVQPQLDQEEEYQALIKQGDKAYKRYRKKASGYALRQKIKAFLFNKGFSSDLINQYLENKEDEED